VEHFRHKFFSKYPLSIQAIYIFSIEKNFKLVQKLNDSKLDNKYSLISSDVISLFTNIPLDLSLKNVLDKWHFILRTCNIPKMNFYMS